jgi:crotonobetainyl-CoA:carnitine CoA-transferase CaiB-like acyl-CoA transferase
MYNSDKKGMTLNLKTKEGLDVLIRLIKNTDVFLTNLQYASLRKMGLDYETLASENPRLIYARANGFGFKGADADVPSMDVLGQARGGNMSLLTLEGEEPRYAVGGICDQAGAFIFAFGIMTALYVREKYGIAQMIETSQLGAMIKLIELAVSGYCLADHPWMNESRKKNKNALWNWYQCRDGRWIVFAHLRSDPFWKDFAAALGLEHLIDDPRFHNHMTREKNYKALSKLIEDKMAEKTSNEWIERFGKFPRVSYSRVNRLEDIPKDPQVLANEYLIDVDHPLMGLVKMVGMPFQFSKTPAKHFRFVAPELGQHTEEVLLEIGGYNWDEITQLRDKGII